MKMRTSALTAAIVALSSFSLRAEVAFWYRFGELEPDAVASSDTRVVNAAHPGDGDLKLYSYSGTAYGHDSSLVPMGTESFSAPLKIWDPLANVYHADDRGMHFGARGDISAATLPGSIAVADSSATPFKDLANVTVEAIFRLKEDVPADCTACIVQKNGPGGVYQPSWGLTINSSGLWQRYRYRTAGGSWTVENDFVAACTVTRGVWHHAAFTFDANGTARLYLDYRLVGTKTSAAGSPLEITDGQYDTLVIGARSGIANSTFPGDIDEVRICDTALSPEQFLRLLPDPQSRTFQDDTAFYQSFDYTPLVGAMDANEVGGGDRLAATLELVSAQIPETRTDVPGNIRQSVTSPACNNVYSLFSETNSLGEGVSIRIDDPNHSIAGGSFTAEMFFKASRPIRDGRAWTLMYGPLKLLIGNGGEMSARPFDRDGGYSSEVLYNSSVAGFANQTTGAWHHYAVVYNQPEKTFTFYADYRRIGSKSCTLATGNVAKTFFFGRMDGTGTGKQCPDGFIDSPRIVRRALRPDEFLTTHPVPVQPRTLAHISFDEDFTVAPYPLIQPAGVAQKAVETGSLPVVTTEGALGEYWLDGEGKSLLGTSSSCVSMNGSRVNFGRNSVFERQEFTFEFFAKFYELPSATQIVRISRNPNDPLWSSTWAIGSGATQSVANHITLRAYVEDQNGVQTGYDIDLTGADGKGFLIDGLWHHYALTVQLDNNGTETIATAYVDHEPAGSPVRITGKLWYPSQGTCFSVGVDKAFSAKIDEIRLSDGVLPVSDFLVRQKKGLAILVR